MKQEVNPNETSRAWAFQMWMKSPVPMVTLVKTFDVTQLCKVCKRNGLKFNKLLCWCLGRAARDIDEFYLLPKDGKLYKFDRLAINVIVDNAKGGISTCDIPYNDDFQQFSRDYDAITLKCSTNCEEIADEEAMILGTSAVTGTELDCIVNQYKLSPSQCSSTTPRWTEATPPDTWSRYNIRLTTLSNVLKAD